MFYNIILVWWNSEPPDILDILVLRTHTLQMCVLCMFYLFVLLFFFHSRWFFYPIIFSNVRSICSSHFDFRYLILFSCYKCYSSLNHFNFMFIQTITLECNTKLYTSVNEDIPINCKIYIYYQIKIRSFSKKPENSVR